MTADAPGEWAWLTRACRSIVFGGGAMASVEVFVDDAVRGRLPHVCVKSGEPAVGRLRVEQARGGFALAWLLLVFLGPLGWLVLLFVVAAGSARRDVLSVRLPYAEAAVDHEIRVRRLRLIGGLTAVASVVLALALAAGDEMSPPVLVVCGLVGVAAVVCAAVQHVRLTLTRVGIELDASRRWVRLSRVHPDFVRAVEAAEAEAAAAERSGMRA